MGVDIHCYAEVRKSTWELAQPLILNEEYTFNKEILSQLYIKRNKLQYYSKLSYADLNTIQKKECDSLIAENTEYPFEEEIAYYKLTPKFIPESINDVRHSEWFAILGYTRLNNIRSLEEYVPIRSARGLPPDLSSELMEHINTFKKEYDINTSDFEIFSNPGWLTLQEIIEFDWNKKIKRFCFMKNLDSYTEPELTDQAVFDKLIKDDGVIFAQDCTLPDYIKTGFTSTYKEAVGEEFLTDFIEQLSSYGTPENVRIVFYFDS